MRRTLVLIAATATLAACGLQQGTDNADDYASRVNGGGIAATPGAAQPDASMPQVASNGKAALKTGATYSQKGGSADKAIQIDPDGTYKLVEDGQASEGKWEWLPDGKRLRLIGVVHQPIVLVANGAIYRMQNENVPFDDVTIDRMYLPGPRAD